MKNGKILGLYQKLRKEYGQPQQQWILWCKRPKTNRDKENIVFGAVLAQRTNWRNVELAILNLQKQKLNSLKKISENKNRKKVIYCIRPAGFYKQKSEYLIGLAKFIIAKYGNISRMSKEPLSKLRRELLNLKGIGPETADSILLYALGKSVFVIDEYTKRLLKAERISQEKNYENLRQLFEKNLPRNYRLYQDFHALIVIDGKNKKGQTI